MASGRSMKDKAMAAMLKDRGIRRTTGQCPGCHRFSYPIAHVQVLITHLNKCGGKRTGKRRSLN